MHLRPNAGSVDNAIPIESGPSFYTWETTNGSLITAYSLSDDISLPNGTVHAIEAIDPNGNPHYTVSSMTGNLSEMMVPTGDFVLPEDYWRPILAGDTTIIGPDAAEFYESNLLQFTAMGDFLVVENEVATGGNDVFVGGPGYSFFMGDAGDVFATLIGGDDSIVAHGQCYIAGDAGFAKQCQVSGGDDTLVLDGPVDDGFYPSRLVGDVDMASEATVVGGDDTIDVLNVLDIGIVVGDLGTAQSATLEGGNDTISARNSVHLAAIYGDCDSGGAGSGGNDIIDLLDSAAVVVSGDFNDLGGAASGGDDQIDLVDSTASVTGDANLVDVAFDLTAGDDIIDASRSSANLTLVGDAVTATSSGARVLGGADQIFGGPGNDVIVGEVSAIADQAVLLAGADQLFGGEGDDQIYGDVQTSLDGSIGTSAEYTGSDHLDGGGGNDTLVGGLGNDTLIGGAGVDTASYAGASAAVTVSLALATAQCTVGDGNDTLSGIENLTGSNFADTLTGSSGHNRLDGGAGADGMVGGTGNDTYVVDDVNDFTNEAAGGGADTVESSISTTLRVNVENLVLTGTAIEGFGNALNNTITGNAQNNRLDGGAGADAMAGGAGDDRYYVDDRNDVTTELAGRGIDTVLSSVSTTLRGNVENLTLTGTAIEGFGNAGNNTIAGNAQNNRLDGGAGADTMTGGLGDDRYYVDNANDVTTELSGQGIDTVFSSVSATLRANVENLNLTGSAIEAFGNTLANAIVGNGENNRIEGLSGDDTLTGAGGADTFVFHNDNGADTVTDFQDDADKIKLVDITGVDDFGDLDLTDTGPGVLVDYGTGTVLLANVADINAIDASDFVFA